MEEPLKAAGAKQAFERNCRVQARYDELAHLGKHGHYETMFQVVREEVERASADLLAALRNLLTSSESGHNLSEAQTWARAAILEAISSSSSEAAALPKPIEKMG